jgi:hypothetical protein
VGDGGRSAAEVEACVIVVVVVYNIYLGDAEGERRRGRRRQGGYREEICFKIGKCTSGLAAWSC